MSLKVYNPGPAQVVNLDHDVMCSEDACSCRKMELASWESSPSGAHKRRDVKRKLHGSMCFLSKEVVENVPNAFEKLPQVQGLLAAGKLKILAKNDN